MALFRADCEDCKNEFPTEQNSDMGVFAGQATISNETDWPGLYPISGELIGSCVDHHVGQNEGAKHRKFNLLFEGGASVGYLVVTSVNREEGLYIFIEGQS